MSDEAIKAYYSDLNISNIEFTTVGSTSVKGMLHVLTDEFSHILTGTATVKINSSGHDGSGDAFKKTGIFDNPSMLIGYQSREAKESEAEA